MAKRRNYSIEFKREAVEQVRRRGICCRKIALEIGVHPDLLTRWEREAEDGTLPAFKGAGNPPDQEVAHVV